MIYSPLEIMIGPIENGVLVGSFTWGDATGASFLGVFYNSLSESLYISVFFKTLVIQLGEVDEED